ncbi:polysaccharide biosynthesis tyrosine autokinase [Williamsia maris]|uniref:non-specific protein-tyrosine kinase n=1 Tax=Williamsia maris TaxID=72806 RepID=A0ABT1HFR3_9NOCA|nr:polysaccharide biosynthesis tyrosine autokinase [Williamsia maris]MCP2177085.1 receptor protein-tyrosine kinase [Williamsia maris]
MAIREYVRIFVKYWWVLILCVVLGGGGGLAYHQFGTTPKYAATAQLFVTAVGGTSVGESYQNSLFSQDRVNSYAAIATSDQVARRASEALGGAISADDLRSETTAVAVTKTVILAITVTDEAPRRAQSYANAVAQETSTVVQELETSQRGGSSAANAVVLDDADLPSSSTGMSWILLTIAGAALGLFIGLLIALGLGLSDRRVRNGPGVKSASGLHVLSEIPEDEAVTGAAVAAGTNANLEPYRLLRTNVRFIGAGVSRTGEAPRVISVTGPTGGEGRTSVAIGLAAALADSGHDVLLIDADLAGDGVAAALSITSDHGLTTTIVGENDLTTGVRRVRRDFSVLVAGPKPPNAAELIASDRFDKLLADARSRFDYVIIDTPAIASSSDATVCAALSDGVVLLARRNRTNRTALRSAAESLNAVGGRIIGVVLTHGAAAGAPGRPTDEA